MYSLSYIYMYVARVLLTCQWSAHKQHYPPNIRITAAYRRAFCFFFLFFFFYKSLNRLQYQKCVRSVAKNNWPRLQTFITWNVRWNKQLKFNEPNWWINFKSNIFLKTKGRNIYVPVRRHCRVVEINQNLLWIS